MPTVTEPDPLRPGEKAVAWPGAQDAALIFIGRIRTPWATRAECPRRGRPDGPLCQVAVDPLWTDALDGITAGSRLELFYWLHRSRRDVVLQTPRQHGTPRGTFSLRSPLRPNPIGTSIVDVVGIEGTTLIVRGLDCLDGTPLIDIKPDRASFTPQAPPTPGDAQVG
jgi:tRNA-Thr(GGU) m(6)t(6)A37 methyltransferase TsaA